MMKKLIFLFAILVPCSFTFSQKVQLKDEISELRVEILDSLQNIQLKNKSFEIELINKNEGLKKNLDEAANTISYLNSVTGTFSNIITFLGILIGIIALVVPFATYQYAVKPSKEALKDLEKYFDTRLEQYLWDNRNRQIDNALLNIVNGSPEERSQAISYLTFIQSEGLSDTQLFQIYSILRKNNSDYNIKSQLAFILTTRRTEFASELFNSKEVNSDPALKQMALTYFAKTGYKNNYDGIINHLEDDSNQGDNFNTLIVYLHQYNSSDINEIFNDTKIIDLLNSEALRNLKGRIPTTINSLGLETNFENSYLSERIGTTTI